MIEGPHTSSPAALVPPEDLVREAWTLEPPAPHEIPGILRDEAGLLLDRLLTRVARGRGALDVALGDGLAALQVGDRTLRLGYSGIGDYAYERLGIAQRTAQNMARLARQLRDRPLLREAVRKGVVSVRKAQAILPLALGDAEAEWVARARAETVRALEAAVREAGRPGGEEDEPWERIVFAMSPEGRAKLDRAMDLAGRLLGAASPKWQRLEAMCEEYLGAHPVEVLEDEGSEGEAVPYLLEAVKEGLEQEMQRWQWLEDINPGTPVEAPAGRAADRILLDPHELDAELRELAGMRERWDELLGHLAMLLRMVGLWRDMHCASFGHYAAERLGMAGRTVEQRIALERRLYELPELRAAMREGRVSYEKARLVARAANETTVKDWITRAEKVPCVALRREIEAAEEAQTCARGSLDLRVPERVGKLLSAAFRAARAAAGEWLNPEGCLVRVAEHFIRTYEDALLTRRSRGTKVLARDGGWCQAPGCSRPAVHVHHVVFRSRGGGNDEANLASLCAAHHLHGVHAGYVRVRGTAPDGLTWELGLGPGGAPLEVRGPTLH
jgi:5-methylcytosine-specific restriction endonuclease McrA